jgi:hypothetical protein
LSSLIPLKQKALAGIYGITIVKDNFTAGHEETWIQFIKSINKRDEDPSHQNLETIYHHLQSTIPEQASKILIPDVVAQTEHPQNQIRKNIDAYYPNTMFDYLTSSPSQSLIVELTDNKNQKHSMAIVMLPGQNGIWLHDAKQGCSYCCDNKNIQDFKDFFAQNIKANYPNFNTASIIQLGINPKTEVDLKTQAPVAPKRKESMLFKRKDAASLTQHQPQVHQTPTPTDKGRKNKKGGPSK